MTKRLRITQPGLTPRLCVRSYGDGCAQPGQLSVYTRISAFSSWIASMVPDLPQLASAPAPPAGVQQQFLPAPGSLACGQAWSNYTTSPSPAIVDCGAFTVASIAFVLYGNPTGNCWAGAAGPCNSATAQAFVTGACVGRRFCYVVRW